MQNETRLLFISTSAKQLPDGSTTGLWLSELTEPYYTLIDAGYTVDIASMHGGEVPLDPRSETDEEMRKPSNRRATDDPELKSALNDAIAFDEIDPDRYAAVFFPGGHGAMMDYPVDAALGRQIGDWLARDTIVAAVCHGPSALVGATTSDGASAIAGRKVTGFSDEEERTVGLDGVVPFALERQLKEKGGHYQSGSQFESYAVQDANLITGQNPQSAEAVGKLMLDELQRRQVAAGAANEALVR